jgi:hypothetical protein
MGAAPGAEAACRGFPQFEQNGAPSVYSFPQLGQKGNGELTSF